MIKGVIFDVDGVLLDSMSAWENLGQMYLKHLGISAEADLGEILSPMSLEEAARYLIDHYGLKWKPEEVVRGINQELKEFYEHQVLLKPGVEIYVNEFCRRNIPMAIATSGDRENAEAALDRLGVLSYFEGICTCSETGGGKSRPDVYFAAERLLHTNPKETWIFEDALHALRTAKRAGFQTVGMYDRSNEKDQGKIRKEADLYLTGWERFEWFWERASTVF